MALVLKELLIGAVPLAILIFSTLGSILCGIATPTEASACGAFGALALVIVYRKFTWKGLAKALHSTILLSSMILIMIASCNFFGSVFSRLPGGGRDPADILALAACGPFLLLHQGQPAALAAE